MQIKVVAKHPEIHTTPLYMIFLNDIKTEIDFDDVEENRWKISFEINVAIKVTAINFCDMKKLLSPDAWENGIYHRYILEVEDSPWIQELKNNLVKSTDDALHILNESHHYILLLGEVVVEVIAYDNYGLKVLEISQREREQLNSQRIYLHNE